jgi:hypothetical protein
MAVAVLKKVFLAQPIPLTRQKPVTNALSPKITLKLEIKVERISIGSRSARGAGPSPNKLKIQKSNKIFRKIMAISRRGWLAFSRLKARIY